MTNFGFTDALLILLAILLVVAAVIDMRSFTIPNGLNAAVALLAPLYWWSEHLPLWPDIGIQIALAAAVFAALAVTFVIGMMGGGDVKLAAALALWFSPASTLKFLVIMSIAGGVLTAIVLITHRLRPGRIRNSDGETTGKTEIPYGVAIAFGALWILAQRFLNHFA